MRPVVGCRVLECLEDAAADAHAAHVVVHPHALDVRGRIAVEQHGAAAHSTAVQAREHEAAVRLGELGRVGVQALRRVEAIGKTPCELRVVGGQAGASIGRCGIRRLDLHEPRLEQVHRGVHRLDEALLLAGAERREQRGRQVVAAPVERSALGSAGSGGSRRTHA